MTVVLRVEVDHPEVLVLGDVHRDLGSGQQGLRVGAVVGAEHESHARLQGERQPVDHQRSVDRLAEPVQHLDRLARAVHLAERDAEPVATESRQQVAVP